MCTADEERIIKAAANKFLRGRKMFTSVDIANDIKLSGTWIRNHVVAGYLRQNTLAIANGLMLMYEQTIIPVTLENGDITEAYLYHPVGTNSDDYADTDQRALDPIAAGKPKAATIHVQSVPDSISVDDPPPATPTLDLSAWRISSGA